LGQKKAKEPEVEWKGKREGIQKEKDEFRYEILCFRRQWDMHWK
jgi:hypothetical protein